MDKLLSKSNSPWSRELNFWEKTRDRDFEPTQYFHILVEFRLKMPNSRICIPRIEDLDLDSISFDLQSNKNFQNSEIRKFYFLKSSKIRF